MERRDALKAIALLPFAVQTMLAANDKNLNVRKTIIKPKRLKIGDTVGVIAPASGVSEEAFEKGLQNLAEMGFKTKVGKYAREQNGFLAGTDKERLHDLHWAFTDKEIKAVWCVRGGYGTSRLLADLDYKLIEKNPKIFIGFSDITALHLAIYKRTGLITFHGPNAASNYSDYSKKHVLEPLMNPTEKYVINLPEVPEGQDPELYKTITITKGKCRGELIGGNLSLLVALAGTQYGLERARGNILFIEDVSESPYRVDRMLTQLRDSVNLRTLAGIAIGVFTKGDPDPAKPSQTLLEVLQERLGDLRIPVMYGLSFGHIRNNFTLPIGIKAEMDTEDSTLTFLESAVT
ncbi:MAG: LD-carboxypeptidase [Acidobacteriota bacterium]|nr:LD-carboxypeptidase [Acidobacteriota bacterium]